MKKVALYPSKWDLGTTPDLLTKLDKLYPVPIATDLKSGRTLILDSNHTVVNIINGLDNNLLQNIKLPVVHIVGRDLENIIVDFKILNRTATN